MTDKQTNTTEPVSYYFTFAIAAAGLVDSNDTPEETKAGILAALQSHYQRAGFEVAITEFRPASDEETEAYTAYISGAVDEDTDTPTIN